MVLAGLGYTPYNFFLLAKSLTVSPVSAAHKYDASFRAGNTSYDPKTATFLVKYDNSKSKRILGLQYIGIEQSAADMVKQFKEKGWLP